MMKKAAWVLGVLVALALATWVTRRAACNYSFKLSGKPEGLIDFHTELTPPDAPTRIHIAGRIYDGVSVVKDITSLTEPGGILLIRIRASLAGFRCATATSSFDATFEIPANVQEVRLGEAHEFLWRRNSSTAQ